MRMDPENPEIQGEKPARAAFILLSDACTILISGIFLGIIPFEHLTSLPMAVPKGGDCRVVTP